VTNHSTEGAGRLWLRRSIRPPAKSNALNEKLSLVRLAYLCHRVPGLRWVGKNISPWFFFQWTKFTAYLGFYFYPADRRRVRYLRQALAASCDRATVRRIGLRYVTYRKWTRHLVYAWPNWVDRLGEWVSLEGEEHLIAALEEGKGALLLSGHAFGFAALVSPVLAQRGYEVYRTGRGRRVDQVTRWGKAGNYARWEYINYGEDRWNRARALNEMRQALKANQIVHTSIRGFPRGEPELEINFCYKKFFLDHRLIRIIELVQATVLPCFAVCDNQGRLVVKIYSGVPPVSEEVVRVFGSLYARYLRETPEFTWIWRRVVQQQEGW
jgi:lauroyl/myristoyl acyltransferase